MSETEDIYERLAAPFDHTFHDTRGGVSLEYISGEQCISRLNDILTFTAWSFIVKEHGINPEADEVWVLGSLHVSLPILDAYGVPTTLIREQFGSQKIKRGRANGNILDIGFDLKGATTDALKKCASLIGVGLYLSKKESTTLASQAPGSAPVNRVQRTAVTVGGATPVCEECGAALTETRFKDGTVWAPTQLAGYGQRKHGRILCMEHYRAFNDAKRAAAVGG